MSDAHDDASPAADGAFDPAAYAAFIGQIELDEIWLASSRIDNHVGTRQPVQPGIGIDARSRWTAQPTGFRVEQTYAVTVRGEQAAALEIEATFGLAFSSRQPMTDELFAIFAEANLPLNTWPYLREYVASVFGRVGWLPFTLPALKRGVPPSEPEEPTPTPAPKRQRKRPARKPAPAS